MLPLDYESLLQLTGGYAELEAGVEMEPLEALACVGAAVHEVRVDLLRAGLHGAAWGGA